MASLLSTISLGGHALQILAKFELVLRKRLLNTNAKSYPTFQISVVRYIQSFIGLASPEQDQKAYYQLGVDPARYSRLGSAKLAGF
ncbi:hypothetical protein BD779DRAFT_1787875, partial [Infundibulicybe gibba]